MGVLGRMADRQDWWGYLVAVLFIILLIIFLIKVFIEFPGLLEWKVVFGSDELEEIDVEELERIEIIEDTISNPKVTKQSKSEHKMGAKGKAVIASTKESRNTEDDEIFPQSTAESHALLSNFMSS